MREKFYNVMWFIATSFRGSGTVRQTDVDAVRERFEVDTRALAVFRVAVASLLAADVLLRSRNLTLYYTGEGVVSRELARAATPEYAFSVFYVLPDHRVTTAAVFLFALLVSLQLAVGYRTRVATMLAFLVVVSIDHRNPFVLSYADGLYALLLFWAVFLPLGERWSVDAVHRERRPRDTVANVATALILLQMIAMYVVNGVHKTTSSLWLEGDAVAVILSVDEVTYLLGNHAHHLPFPVFTFTTYLWLALMLASPLLLMFTGRRRTAFAAIYVLGHLSLAPLVRIGAFSFVSISGLLLFLHQGFWSGLERAAEHHAEVATDKLHAGVTALASRLPNPRVSEWFDDRHRDAAATLTLVFLAVAGVHLVTYNTGTTAEASGAIEEAAEPPGFDRVANVLDAFGANQHDWDIFAPDPKDMNVYYVAAGEKDDGSQVDLYSDRPLEWSRPHEQLNQQYDNSYRDRFYMDSVWTSHMLSIEGAAPEVEYSEHLCRTNPDVEHIELYQVIERPEGSVDDRPRNAIQILQHRCSGSDVAPEPRVTPPTEFEPVEGGHEKAGGETLVATHDSDVTPPELTGNISCTVNLDAHDPTELHRHVKQLERTIYPAIDGTVTSVGVHTAELAKHPQAYRFTYHVRIYPEDGGLHQPEFYLVRYTVSDDGVHRDIQEHSFHPDRSYLEEHTGYVDCLSR